MSRIKDKLSGYEEIDGLRVDLKDSWFLIRPSGTEPYIRITCEARTGEKAERLMRKCKELFSE